MKSFDRTPSDVAYILLHGHHAHGAPNVLQQRYGKIPKAAAVAKRLLSREGQYYRIDLMGYCADGSLWHSLPLATYQRPARPRKPYTVADYLADQRSASARKGALTRRLNKGQ